MIKLPVRQDGQWTLRQNSDKLPDIIATRNMTFDKEGYIRLSKPTTSFYSSTDDADFGLPIFYWLVGSAGAYYVLTQDTQFELDMYDSGSFSTLSVTKTSTTNAPVNTSTTSFPDAVQFNKTAVYINPTDRKAYTHPAGAFSNPWTVNDISASIATSVLFPVTYFINQANLAVANDDFVDQFNTAFSAGTQLAMPNDYGVTGVSYSNGFVGVTTHNKQNTGQCAFFVWDGNSTEANYTTTVPATSSYSPTPYRGSFVFVDGNAVLQYWTPTGLQPLVALPSYYSNATFSNGRSSNNRNHSILTDGDLIHVNLKSQLTAPDNEGRYYNELQVGGHHTYDPAVGLYHRHAPTATKVIFDTIATTSVNTSTDVITVTTAPDTGTPVRYYDDNSTAITELTNGSIYYTIKVTGTTIKLATTYQNAIDGTAIDLTGTGNSNQTLHFYPKSDFGQSLLQSAQGCLHLENSKTINSESAYQDFFYGASCAQTSTTEVATGGFVLKDTENRGYFITAKLMSNGLQDDWQKIYLKHKNLSTALDKIVVKYRTTDNEAITKIKTSTDGNITWSDENTFTTTDTQWANVSAGDEVEIIQGAGSGYLAHVSSISEAGGTYTVNIDEDIKNISASDTGRAIASGWTKLTTITSSTVRNSDGYSEIPVGVKSKQIQFKVELRGEDIEIEEILVANELSKPA